VKNFCSAQDIEDLAAQGKTELIVDENTVLTDLARHTAAQLGIRLVHRSVPPARALPSLSQPTRGRSLELGSKPKGCQHPPLTRQQPMSAPVSDRPNTVVDQLVGLVKRLGGRGSGAEANLSPPREE
jgi:hypothetical protein